MEFGDTYILLFGYQIFEPITILTNLFIFAVSIFYFKLLFGFPVAYTRNMALFVLMTGLGSFFGSIAHGAQHQLGILFFKVVLFLMHASTLVSAYFCFTGSYHLQLGNKERNKVVLALVVGLLTVLLILATMSGSFVLMKVAAGLALAYMLLVHIVAFRKELKGSGWVISGIFISFSSIFVHSFKLSIDEWFNHKDIAHLIICLSLIIICKGILKINGVLIERT
jgi:hypothetical protein